MQSFANLDENMITYWSKAIMSNGLKFADLDEIMITSLSVLHGGLFVHVVLSLEHRKTIIFSSRSAKLLTIVFFILCSGERTTWTNKVSGSTDQQVIIFSSRSAKNGPLHTLRDSLRISMKI